VSALQERTGGKVTFVGAGPGAADLITLRGAKAIADADVVIWAASLVHEDVLQHARPGVELVDSSLHTVEEILPVYDRAARHGLKVARVHSGDPALWGAIQEQLERCAQLRLETEVVPGVSAFTAAVMQRELTIPEVGQSVILTRLEGGKTPMPQGESVREFARHGTTMVLFLSAARSKVLQDELLAGGYPPETPCIVGYRVTWPDEQIRECRLDQLEATIKDAGWHKHTLVLVGPALGAGGTRSQLYHPGHFNEFRRADPDERAKVRDATRARRLGTTSDQAMSDRR
jgi:precorrin-4/cobalt-precorrin-4 C11-methyltransferase